MSISLYNVVFTFESVGEIPSCEILKCDNPQKHFLAVLFFHAAQGDSNLWMTTQKKATEQHILLLMFLKWVIHVINSKFQICFKFHTQGHM